MEITSFINHFSPWMLSNFYKYRNSPALREKFDTLPTDPQFYVKIAQEHLSKIGGCLNDNELQRHEHLDEIFRELVYYDGRTFEACLYMAEWAYSRPEMSAAVGINALASVKAAIERYPLNRKSRMQILEKLDRLSLNENLHHNASACRTILMRSSA